MKSTRSLFQKRATKRASIKAKALPAAVLCCACSAQATTITWSGAASGTWNNTSNWAGSALPGSSDTALFNSTGLNVSGTMLQGAAFTINTLKIVDPTSDIIIGPGSNFTIAGGGIDMSNATRNLTLKTSVLVFSGGGSLNVAAGRTLTLVPATVTSSGFANGTFTVNGSGLVSYVGNLYIARAGTSAATLALSSGSMTVNDFNVGFTSGLTGSFNVTGGVFTQTSNNFSIGGGSGTIGGVTGNYTQSGNSTVSANALVLASGSGSVGNFTVNGGAFSATSFTTLAGGTNSVVTMVLAGGTTTLPAFPTTRGTGAIANITFDGGTLQANASSATYMQGLTNAWITNNGAIIDTNGKNITIGQALADGTAASTHGPLTKQGAGTLTLTGSNSFSGGLTVSSGTLQVNGSLTGGTYASTISNAGVLGFGNTANQTLSGAISGTGSLIQSGTSVLTLTGSNTYTGTTTVSSGTLQINGDGTYPGSLSNSGALVFGASTDQSVSGAISGPGALVQSGAGTLTLTGSNSYSGATTIASGTLAFNSSAAQTLSGIVSGTGALIQSGPGTLTLTGSNTCTGPTTITGGTLQINAVLGGGTYGAAISNAGALVLSGTVNQTLSGIISGTGSLTQSGASTLTLSSSNSYTGPTTIGSGTLQLSGGGAYAGGISNATRLVFNNTSAQTITGPISGVGALSQSGSSLLTLAGSNTYTGATTLNSGTLQIGDGTTGSLAASGTVSVNAAGTLVVNLPNGGTLGNAVINSGAVSAIANGANTISGNLSGVGGFNQSGAGTTILSGSNSFTGPTSVTAGTLQIGAGGVTGWSGSTSGVALGTGATLAFSRTDGYGGNFAPAITGSGAIVINSGTLTLVGANTYTGPTTVTGGKLQIGSGGVVGTIVSTSGVSLSSTASTVAFNRTDNYGGNFSVAVGGSGNLLLGAGTLVITGSNTYTGTTTISSGTLQLGDGVTDGSIASSGGIANSATLVYNLIGNQGYSNTISGTGALIKAWNGTLTLTGSNTYTGATIINGGTLQIGNGTTGSLAASGTGVTVNAGGALTLNLGGAGTFASPIYNYGTVNLVAGGTNTITGNIYGWATGVMNQSGSGTTILSGNNDYYGVTNISAGVLQLNSQYSGYCSTENVGVNGALVFGTNTVTIGALSGSGNIVLLNGTNGVSLTVGNNGFDTSYAGTITGTHSAAALIKTGTGTFNYSPAASSTISTVKAFGGSLTLSGGSLTGCVNVGQSGTLAVQGGSLIINANSYVAANGIFSGSGTLDNQGGTITQSAGAFTLGQNGQGTFSQESGFATINDFRIATGVSGGGSGTVTISGGTATLGVSMGAGTGSLASVAVSGGLVTLNSMTTLASGSGSQAHIILAGGTTTMAALGTTRGVGATADIKFDGGVLRPAASSTAYLSGLTNAWLTNNGAIIDSNGNNINIAQSLSDYSGSAGTLTKQGAGTLTLSGSNTFTGSVTINAGALQSSNDGALSTTGTITLNNAGSTLAVSYGGASDYTQAQVGALLNRTVFGAATAGFGFDTANGSGAYSNALTMAGGITKLGANTLILSGSNSYTGTTTISAGTLQANHANALGNGGDIVFGGGTLQYTSASAGQDWGARVKSSGSAISLDTNGQNVTLAGSIDSSNTAGLTKTGAGTLTLAGQNSYTGATAVNAGVLRLDFSASGAPGSNILASSGTLTLGGGNFYVLGSGTGSVTQTLAGATQSTAGVYFSSFTMNNNGLASGSTTLALGPAGFTHTSYATAAFDLSQGLVAGGANAITTNAAAATIPWATLRDATTVGFARYNGSQIVRLSGQLALPQTGVGAGNSNDYLLGTSLAMSGTTQVRIGTLTIDAASAPVTLDLNGQTLNAGGVLVTGSNNVNITNGALSSGNTSYGREYEIHQMGSGVLTFSGSINTTTAIVKDGPGTFVITGTNTTNYSAYVNQGSLQYATINSLGTTPALYVSGSGTLAVNYGGAADFTQAQVIALLGKANFGTATTALAFDTTNGDGVYSNALTMTAGLTKLGAGTLTLSGINTYSGGTTVTSGTLAISGSGTLGAPVSTLSANSGVLDLGATSQTVGAVTVAGGVVQNGTLTGTSYSGQSGKVSASLSGTGALAKTTGGTLALTGSNSYGGGTTVSSGSLQLGNANALGMGGLTVNGGSLDLNGNSVSVGALSGTGGLLTNSGSGAGTLATTVASGSSTFAGNIASGSGTVALTKSGTGTLVLSGSLAMSGLNANGGVTQLTQSGSIGAVSVAAGATLSMAAHSGSTYNVLNVSSLTLSGSTSALDLWNNSMIVQASGTAQNAANLAAIQGLVNLASNGLHWNGAGGIGSTTAFNEAGVSGVLVVAAFDNNALTLGSFEGVALTGFDQVLVKLTYLGDLTADGLVDGSDYANLDYDFQNQSLLGDINGDGVVDGSDYALLDYGFQNQTFGVLAGSAAAQSNPLSAPAPAQQALGTGAASASPEAVPEPGALGMLVAGATALLGFRRKAKRSVR